MFATTRWSIVLRAGGSDSTAAALALARLCQTYWYPLYAHVRRRGYGVHDAQDLTQEFFARLLARRLLGRVDAARGRFRSFLLTSLNHFLTDEWEKARARKRGGHHQLLPLDCDAGEQRFALEPADHNAPDKVFDRKWALALLDAVLHQLEAEYAQAGKGDVFAVLRQVLVGPRGSHPYAVLAAGLGRSEGAIKVAVHRLRRRYRELLQAEIAETVASAEDAAAELQHLFQAVAGETR